MRARELLEENPEVAYALAGRLAFLKHEKRAVARARRRMLEAAYLAALEMRGMGRGMTGERAANLISSYAGSLAKALFELMLPAMSAAARLGSYGVERVELARGKDKAIAVRNRHTREQNRLLKTFSGRSFNGRDLEERCEAAAGSFISNMASAALQCLEGSEPEGAARAIEEYAAFGLRDKPRQRDVGSNLPDNPGQAADLLVISELNYAYNAGTATSGRIFYGYVGSRWMLSPLHTVEDICDEYATQDQHGLGAGVYPRGHEPAYPHPMCRCWLAPVFKVEGK